MEPVVGILRKMTTQLVGGLVQYSLVVGSKELPLNSQLGKEITLHFKGEIHCLACGSKTTKSYAQGYCYACYLSSPETEACVLRPELCTAQWGVARDLKWAEEHHLQAHCVYLALTPKLKVGVTRASQVPTRWMDQGAQQALILAETPNRYIAGIIEVKLKEILADKTAWQLMVKGELPSDDLHVAHAKCKAYLPEELQQYIVKRNVVLLNFPVMEYPLMPQSLNLDTTSTIHGTLMGIKGQYLLLNDNRVINLRRHGGYLVSVK